LACQPLSPPPASPLQPPPEEEDPGRFAALLGAKRVREGPDRDGDGCGQDGLSRCGICRLLWSRCQDAPQVAGRRGTEMLRDTHGVGDFAGDNLPKTIEFNQILGNSFLLCRGGRRRTGASGRRGARTAICSTNCRTRSKPHGMRVGYHQSFYRIQSPGRAALGHVFRPNQKEVVMQFDTGNAMQGGGRCHRLPQQYRAGYHRPPQVLLQDQTQRPDG